MQPNPIRLLPLSLLAMFLAAPAPTLVAAPMVREAPIRAMAAGQPASPRTLVAATAAGRDQHGARGSVPPQSPLTAAAPALAGPGGPLACTVFVDKTVRPASIVLGDEVEITLAIEARCPGGTGGGPADIVLALDRSASMGDNGHWQPAVEAAAAFLDLIDFSSHQVALVSFSGGIPFLQPDSTVHQTLSADGAEVVRALRSIPAPPTYTGPTNLTAATRAAQDELRSARHRPQARPVLVLLTDGEHNAVGARSPLDEAADAKQAGTQILTVGLGTTAAAADQLRQIASAPELFFESPSNAELKDVYTAIAGQIAGGTLTELEVVDLLTPDVAYIADSAVPLPSLVQADELRWTISALPPSGWAARYRVRPLRAGTYATNKLAYVDYLDGDGSVGSVMFPQPVVTVRLPGENGIFLPLVMRGFCPPQRPFDVALVMDTSSSMSGEKLASTRVAASEFLDLLPMPPSRAAVVAFSANAQVIQPLTTDRARAAAALDNLPRDEGTRIDLALNVARQALTGADASPNHAKVIVLLTDGMQSGAPPQEAINAAAAARRAGITVFTIGVGPDADQDFLVRLAGDPDRHYPAADESSLLKIYRAIAGTLPCTVP